MEEANASPTPVAEAQPVQGKAVPEWWIRKRDKVGVCGFSPSSKDLAPFQDDTWELWGCNELYRHVPRLDAIFEIHNWEEYPQSFLAHTNPGHMEWLKNSPIPIMMWKKHPEIKASVTFPWEEIFAMFPRKYLNNSISLMIAMAILLDFKEIGIWGVDMAHKCLGPDTKVLMEDLSWRAISELKQDDQVVAYDEEPLCRTEAKEGRYRFWRKAVVRNKVVLKRPSYKIHLEDGTEIIASAEHRWLTHACNMHQWRETKDLVTNMHREGKPTKMVKVVDTWQEDTSYGAGYLAGAFDGEGSLSQFDRIEGQGSAVRLTFAQKENAMAYMVENLLSEKGFSFGESQKDDCHKYYLLGGISEALRFLMQIRPKRLLEKFNCGKLGWFRGREHVAVESIEDIGEQEVIGLETSTGTYIAEGFASHNSEYGTQRPSVEYYLGIADGLFRARGYPKLFVAPQCDLLKAPYVYGQEDGAVIQRIIRESRDHYGKQVGIYSQQLQQNMMLQQQYIGGQAALDAILTNHLNY